MGGGNRLVPRRAAAIALGLLALAGALASPSRADEPPDELTYRISLDVNPASGEVRGESEIALVNSSQSPLDHVPLLLYGNRFHKIDPAINDTNFGRYYSLRFHAGETKIESVTTGEGSALTFNVPAVPAMPAGTYVHVKLAAPVAPGGVARIKVKFTTLLPDRLGMFGRRGERLVAEGGVWPLVPARARSGAFEPSHGAMRARHRIEAKTTSGEIVVDGVAAVGTAVETVAPTVALAAGEDLSVIAERPAQPAWRLPAVSYRGPAGQRDHATRVVALVGAAAQRFARDWLPEDEPMDPIVVVEAPLRDRLAYGCCSVVLASDRLFEVFPHFDSFHEREVQRVVFEVMARRSRTLARLEADDLGWVAEAVAWVALEDWDANRGTLKGEDVRARLGLIDFIPVVDGMLRAPKFASSDVYFGKVYEPRESVRDELDRLGSSRPRGRVLAEKLRDKLGTEKLKALARATLGREGESGKTLRERAVALSGEDLGPFFDLWLGPAPRENLSIESRDAATLPGGKEGLAVSVRRTTDDPRLGAVGEPVTVELDSGGKKERAVWDGKGDSGVIVFPRGGVLYTVTIDPELRIDELDRDDDVWPAFVKLLLNRFKFKIDLNGGNRHEVDLGLTLHPFYKYDHSFVVDAFYAGEGRGGRFAYAYHFGNRIDEVSFGHTIAASVLAQSLGTGLLRDAEKTLTESSGRLVTYGLGYSLDTRTDPIRPTHGFHFGVSGEASDDRIGGDFTYQAVHANAIAIVTPFRPATLAFEAIVGQVFGSRPPTQSLFDAGGEGAVRGVRTGDFVDRALFVARGELRVSVLEDLDVNLLYVGWWRRMELVGFVDGGDVGADVREVFRAPSGWKMGLGTGLRFEIDALGIRPTLLRFDIAWRGDHGDGSKRGRPQFYVGVNQSF